MQIGLVRRWRGLSQELIGSDRRFMNASEAPSAQEAIPLALSSYADMDPLLGLVALTK